MKDLKRATGGQRPRGPDRNWPGPVSIAGHFPPVLFPGFGVPTFHVDHGNHLKKPFLGGSLHHPVVLRQFRGQISLDLASSVESPVIFQRKKIRELFLANWSQSCSNNTRTLSAWTRGDAQAQEEAGQGGGLIFVLSNNHSLLLGGGITPLTGYHLLVELIPFHA